MNKTLVIDLRVVGIWSLIVGLLIGFVVLIGVCTSAVWHWPVEVTQLQAVVLADGQTAIAMTCREVPGSYMQFFGTAEERVATYYSLDGGEAWLLEDFSGVELEAFVKHLRILHRQWLHRQWLLSPKPQVLNADVDAVTVD